ncbi:MAG: restriction endonuclease subunit S [Janthinobacterium lividum]
MDFQLLKEHNPDNVFLLHRSELTSRLEVEYYKPSIYDIENLVKGHTLKKLSDFIVKIASGATPTLADAEKYYSDKETGIPFLRVQNLQTNGVLNLTDVKYINKETHEGYLKRSQVSEFDLLIKITGVGRMAIASVAPKGFIGNINQHIVVIKTGNKEISDYLAKYLNLDIVEKLASRRATGATRPALDYPALKSIPIIENIDFSIIDQAVKLKKEKDEQAKEILNSIDDYISTKLGISIPISNKNIPYITFEARLNEISGSRIDPNYISKYKLLVSQQSNYKLIRLKDILLKSPQYGANEEAIKGEPLTGTRYIRITDINELGNLKSESWVTAKNIEEKYLLEKNNLLFARSGSVGKCYLHKAINRPAIFAGYLIRFVVDTSKADPNYIFYYCNSKVYWYWVAAIHRPAVQSNINSEEYKSLPIVLPDLDTQIEIATHISKLREYALQLQSEGFALLRNAKRTLERTITN